MSAISNKSLLRTINIMSNISSPLFSWLKCRSVGVLMHPTSLPGAQGIGVLNSAVDDWLELLAAAGIRYWQVCPLGPTGYGDSPYQCFSAFAGNPYLIDLNALVRAELLSDADLAPLTALPRDHVDFGWLYVTKWPALFRAYTNFKTKPSQPLPYGDFERFRAEQRDWLEPFGLFQALKDHHHPKPWWEWPDSVRFFKKAQSSRLPDSVYERAEAHAFFQYLFFGQWREVRQKAQRLGIEIIGDAPIFVARDSADVWSNPELFQIDRTSGQPVFVAGVPPDYFSADGQLWGNPLYAWESHALDGYRWWLSRLRTNFQVCDVLRIDHFRAFDTYWSIPAIAKTAKTGSWKPGPGTAFFQAIKEAMPDARLIAEDLGELMPSVVDLREATGLPGMAILQFAFGGDAQNAYLPHNQRANSVVYPGTHDNDATLGWYHSTDEKTRDHVRRYFRVSGAEAGWDFIRASYASVANLAVIPLQDLLSLGAEARFNTPGVAAGNWQWRYQTAQLSALRSQSADYLMELGVLYGRTSEAKS
ncbi:4-alpha-glucanotransferase [Nibricoccus aquaticus]|uniref:4-alpha-glucanotransferase n=2 Tax=Nibricoccus aquaticus TaxID=2576891 RepID=A0A290QN78_9BACT|nr:4-alpha-glucanotransferase [Nibricoccus aquaticus]